MFYLVGAGYLLNLTLRHGMVWYIFSMSIITINDIMAYMAGFFTGCTPLIVLSPKKTVEGFIGGGLATLVLGPLLAARLQEIATLTAAWEGVTPLGAEFYSGHLSPFVMHCFAISVFARYIYKHTEPESYKLFHSIANSTLGPFAGFFCSGFKRASDQKNFGCLIPGHGGVLDR